MLEQHTVQQLFDHHALGAVQLGQRLKAQPQILIRATLMDANEYALKVTPAAKSLGLLIRQAVWLGTGKAPPTPSALPTVPNLPLKSASSPINAGASSYEINSKSEPVKTSTPVSSLAAEPVALPALPVLPATPMPEAAEITEAARGPWVEVVQREAGREVHIRFGDGAAARAWRVRGLEKNLSPDTLKVNVRIATHDLLTSPDGGAFHVDTLGLLPPEFETVARGAGLFAIARAAVLMAQGIECFRIQFPKGTRSAVPAPACAGKAECVSGKKFSLTHASHPTKTLPNPHQA